MNERDKELAEQAEKYADDNFKGEPTWSEAFEQKFADLIRADEREACAKVCEQDDSMRWSGAADAIRARKVTK